MSLGITREEAEFIDDAISYFCKNMGKDTIEVLYPDIDLLSISTQLSIIKEIGCYGKDDII